MRAYYQRWGARGRKGPREGEEPRGRKGGEGGDHRVDGDVAGEPASMVARQVAAESGEPRAAVPSRGIASVDVSGSALVASAARAAAYFGWREGAVRTMRSSARFKSAGVDE